MINFKNSFKYIVLFSFMITNLILIEKKLRYLLIFIRLFFIIYQESLLIYI